MCVRLTLVENPSLSPSDCLNTAAPFLNNLLAREYYGKNPSQLDKESQRLSFMLLSISLAICTRGRTHVIMHHAVHAYVYLFKQLRAGYTADSRRILD